LSAPARDAGCFGNRISHQRRGVLDQQRRLIQRSEHGWLPPSAIAVVEQALGNYEAAFRWLERAYETRDFLCVVLPVEAIFRVVAPGHDRAIVDDPRWRALVERVGMFVQPDPT